MPVSNAMTAMTVLEVLLWAVLGYLFWSKNLQRRYPFTHRYLLLNAVSMPILAVFLQVQSHFRGPISYSFYFFGYWASYIAGAVLLLYVCLEMFRSALSGFSGLMRFGVVIFRWAVLLSVISCISSVSFRSQGILVIAHTGVALMRAVSIVELGLLAFLCLAMNALQLSYRNLCFGIPAGFVFMSINDYLGSTFMSMYTNFGEPIQFIREGSILLILGMWIAYVAVPEPARKPVVLSANSTIYRWNEIASALGTKGTNVVTVPQHAAASFFLTDVEKVVDKVLAKNLKRSET